LSFAKGLNKFKKKQSKGSDSSEPPVTNQMSTFNSENQRLDPGAFTETQPDLGQTKTGATIRHEHAFTKGFKKKLKDIGPTDDNPPSLYPGPNQAWNLSGSDKVAFAGPHPVLKPPTESIKGINTGIKPLTTPKRVTPNMGPYGAPKGASGVTGVPTSQPFKKSFGNFGHKTRQAMKSITRSKLGV
jgi:hypothetical protein